MKKRIFLAVAVIVAIALALRAYLREPSIHFALESERVGTKPFAVKVSGVGNGLKNVRISYAAKDKTLLLENKNYPEGVKEDTLSISLNPIAGIEDGPAEVIAEVQSYAAISRLKFGQSSVTKIKKINADISPPQITLISGTENILQGGSAVAVYKISEDTAQSGIEIGESFFKGHKAAGAGFSDKNIRISFFSYPHNLPEGETILIVAADETGNKRRLPLNYNLNKKVFPEEDIEVTEKFIKMKMLPMINYSSDDISSKDIFLLVNRKLRSLNDKKIDRTLSKTAEKIIWEGRFLRPVGALQSQFEKRNYFFEGELTDQQYHLGYDLASRKNNPVRASNNGTVVFADDLGIYGNSIIIDHGMGVATLYGHLSSMTVSRGDAVVKGDKIGSTGATGLAFGDHLHFGIYVGGHPVVPTEWWDEFWVQTRILDSIEEAKTEIQQLR